MAALRDLIIDEQPREHKSLGCHAYAVQLLSNTRLRIEWFGYVKCYAAMEVDTNWSKPTSTICVISNDEGLLLAWLLLFHFLGFLFESSFQKRLAYVTSTQFISTLCHLWDPSCFWISTWFTLLSSVFYCSRKRTDLHQTEETTKWAWFQENRLSKAKHDPVDILKTSDSGISIA